MPERLPMQRRTAGTRARVLAMVVASALGPVGAAEAAGPVTVKAKLAGQDATSTAIFVRVDSTVTCREIQLLATGVGGAQTFPGPTKSAAFAFTVDTPPGPLAQQVDVAAQCLQNVGGLLIGNGNVRVPPFVPPPPPRPAGGTGKAKNGPARKYGSAASKRSGTRAAIRGAAAGLLPARLADAYARFAARELAAAVPLERIAALGLPTGALASAPVPAPRPAAPDMSAFGAGAADIAAAFDNAADQARLGAAAIESLARHAEALRVGNAAAAATQRAAAADMVDRWASALGAAQPLRAAAQTVLAATPGYGPVDVTSTEAAAIAAAARGGTLPAGIGEQLAADGVAPDVVEEAIAVFADRTPLVLTGYAPTLEDLTQASAESATVVQLRALAAALRSPAGGGGTPTPVPGRRLPHGVGELRPVACAAASTAGCVRGRAMSDTAFVTVSSNGRFVYVSSRGAASAVTGFRRDLASGRLTPIAGPKGCVSANGTDGCQAVAGISTPSQIAIGPASRDLYLASGTSNAVFAFRIAKGSGRLTPNGCLTDGQPGRPTAPGCTIAAPVIGNLKNLAISPDGRHVYAPSYSWGIVSIFARDRGTGRLRYVGCVGDQRRGCARPAPLMLGPRGIAVLRDGRTVVVAAQDANAAIGFDRDPVTGWLTQSSCVAGSGAVRPPAGCSAGVAISSPENVAVGSDADEVIVSSTGISSLVRLRRDAATGTLRVVDAGAPCVTDRTDAATALCRSHPGLSSTYGVALSPDGQQVYSASYTPGAVGAFTVDPRSRELVGVGPCFSSTDTACTRRAGLARAGVIAIAPDARHIYVAAPDSSTVTAFARRMVVRPVALVRGRPRITRQGGVDVNVACPPTMVGWCVGTATGRVVGRRGVRIASRAAQVIVPPGTTRRVRLAFPRAIRALGGRVRIEVRATMREPFGATARSQARIVVRR